MRRLAVFFLTIISFSVARADTIYFSGVSGADSYKGTANVIGTLLTISIKNTSASNALTGFGFNSEDNVVVSAIQNAPYAFSTNAAFGNFGVYEYSATTTISPNITSTFEFNLSASGVSEWDFFTKNGTGPLSDPFVASFSDSSVVGDVAVPLPATALSGLSLFGFFGIGRRLYIRRRIAI